MVSQVRGRRKCESQRKAREMFFLVVWLCRCVDASRLMRIEQSTCTRLHVTILQLDHAMLKEERGGREGRKQRRESRGEALAG